MLQVFSVDPDPFLPDETQLHGDVTGLLEFVPGGGTGTGFGDFSNFTAGNIAVIDRGVTAFTNKILAAEAAGAIGLVAINSSTNTGTGLGNVQVHIPTILMNINVGTDLKTDMLGSPVTARLQVSSLTLIPQAPGIWNARVIGIDAANGDGDINDTLEALGVRAFADGGPNTNGWNISVDVSDTRNIIDMAGGGGSFPDNHAYPDGTAGPNSGEDFLISVQTALPLHVPEGDWTIAFGSDDGGALQIPGVTFTSRVNSDTDGVPDDTIFFNGTRGHGWTMGHFTVGPGGQDISIDAVMFERAGGDSFEIAIAQGHRSDSPVPGAFTILGEGALGWTTIPEPSTFVLGIVGLIGLLGVRRRRR